MRLHVVSLPHTQTTSEYLHCAYTQKVVKFCRMMLRQGCEVYLYSGEENEADCTEHVPLLTEEQRRAWFGRWDPNGLFDGLSWDPSEPYWQAMNSLAIPAIRERAVPRDFLCLTAGWSQSPISDALGHELLPVEWAVGYEGITLPYRVFESYAWMHHVYGLHGIKDGRAYDAVIPNFFDPEDFDVSRGAGEHLLFIGRLVQRKGPHVAADIAARCGRKLIVAGPGAVEHGPGYVQAPEVRVEAPGLEYVGPVDAHERAELMASAAAVIVPTQYIEPFGGVAVEAMMCGTPVVTTDWGAFTETVTRVTGRRFHTLQEGALAVEQAVQLDPDFIREEAHRRYSLAAVAPHFCGHLNRLATLWGEGWYA